MTRLKITQFAGHTFIELLMVMVILAALAAIAIPHYINKKEKALAVRCLSNRYHIELEEKAYYIEHGEAGFVIDDIYKCPSGGTYVWLVTDPNVPGYPKIGCSLHYIGDDDSTEIVPEEPETIYYIKLMEIMDNIANLDLPKGLKTSLLSKLTSAHNSLTREDNTAAIDNLNSFINHVKAQREKQIDKDEADTLIADAQGMIDLLQ